MVWDLEFKQDNMTISTASRICKKISEANIYFFSKFLKSSYFKVSLFDKIKENPFISSIL